MAFVLPNGLILKEIDTIDCYQVGTGNFLFTIDELTASSIANSEESQDTTGKGGRLLSRTKKNKSVTVSGTNGVISAGLMELQTGGEFSEDDTAEIEWCDILTVKNSAATTSYMAVGTAGAEIVELYIKGANGLTADQLTQADSVSAGKFTYNPATRALAFNSDIADGTEIAVYYKRRVAAVVLDNNSDEYSGQATMYVNGLAEDKCSNVYRVQIYFPKVDFNGNFSLDTGDSQTVHSFEASAMAGACGAGSLYYRFIVFGANEADAKGVKINKSATTIAVGGSGETLTATVDKSLTGAETVTWSSDAQAVATVTSGGVLAAVGAGTANITATCGNYTDVCVVTVTAS